MLKIGDKLVLTKEYYIPALLFGSSTEWYEVVVIEEKKVPGAYNRNRRFSAFRAVDDQGKEFTVNWEIFPDDSWNAWWEWHEHNNKWGVWYWLKDAIVVDGNLKIDYKMILAWRRNIIDWLCVNMTEDELMSGLHRRGCVVNEQK